MKKVLVAFLAVVFCMSFMACSKKDNSDENPITHYKSGDVTLGEYKGLEYTPFSTEVTDEEFDTYIEYLLSTKSSLSEKPADAVAEEGDVVSVDFVGKLDGVAFDGGTGSKEDLELGSNSFIEDFEQGLIGKPLGKYDVPCTFPENYHNADMAGKEVIFEITIKKISEKVDPEFNDAFCDDFTSGEYKTVEEFSKYIKETIKEYKEEDAENQKTTDLTIAVVNACTFNKDLTSDVEESKTSILNYYNAYCSANYGVTAKVFYQAQYGFTDEQFDNFITDQAEMAVKYRYATSAIAEKENITVSDEEAQKFAEDNYARLGYGSVDEFFAAVESQQEIKPLDFCREQYKLDKANEVVMNSAVAKAAEEKKAEE